MNAADSPIHSVTRLNEVSSHFEDSLRELLSSTPALSCDLPRTAERKVQRSGYPDLRLIDLSPFKVKLKAEFQGSNRDLYRAEAIVASSAK